MLESIIKINQAVNGFIWGVPAMICIIGVGLLLSVRTRFIQVRKFGAALKNMFPCRKNPGYKTDARVYARASRFKFLIRRS